MQILAQGSLKQSGRAQSAAAPQATLTLERYRTAHHRYWMDQ
ncbi:MAG: hypothetical protein RXR20_27415 [Paraburkholderia sp.]